MSLGKPLDTQEMYALFPKVAQECNHLFFPQIEGMSGVRDRRCPACTKAQNDDDAPPFITEHSTLILTSWALSQQKPVQAKFIYTCTRCGNMQVISEKI